MLDTYYEPCGYVDLSKKLAFECKTDPRAGISTGIPTLKKQPDEDIIHYKKEGKWFPCRGMILEQYRQTLFRNTSSQR